MDPKNVTNVQHHPVLLQEVIKDLSHCKGGMAIDCTVGGGGHTAALLEAVGPTGKVLGLDADPAAIQRVSKRFSAAITQGQLALVQANFGELKEVASQFGFHPVAAILFDLGLSSFQLDTAGRGFSFRLDGPLDMRFDPEQRETAHDIVNTWDEESLADLLYNYGEERRSRSIAKRIVANRPIQSTKVLAEVVARTVPKTSNQRIHPATRTFQALRIAVNRELTQLQRALTHSLTLLKPTGRIAVISFHSLEDRIVKQWMRAEAQTYVRDDSHPMGGYEKVANLNLVTRKPITPSAEEIQRNPRSRSAKLRIAERV